MISPKLNPTEQEMAKFVAEHIEGIRLVLFIYFLQSILCLLPVADLRGTKGRPGPYFFIFKHF